MAPLVPRAVRRRIRRFYRSCSRWGRTPRISREARLNEEEASLDAYLQDLRAASAAYRLFDDVTTTPRPRPPPGNLHQPPPGNLHQMVHHNCTLSSKAKLPRLRLCESAPPL